MEVPTSLSIDLAVEKEFQRIWPSFPSASTRRIDRGMWEKKENDCSSQDHIEKYVNITVLTFSEPL